METAPIVSVIIPVYNAENFLHQCLGSVINQALENIEIICVDDGSSDGSLQILREYEKQDSRVIVVAQENINAGAARNRGISVAKGKYLHFLDADDWVEPSIYLKTVQELEKTNCDACIFNYKKCNAHTGEYKTVYLFTSLFRQKNRKKKVITTFDQSAELFINATVVPWNKLYRREFILGNGILFDELKCSNDRTFYFRAISSSSSVVLLSTPLIVHRIGNDNSLEGKNTRIKHFDNVIQAFYNTERFTQACNPKVRLEIFSKSVTTILYFFKLVDGKNNPKIVSMITDFFHYFCEIELYRDSLWKFAWFPQYVGYIYPEAQQTLIDTVLIRRIKYLELQLKKANKKIEDINQSSVDEKKENTSCFHRIFRFISYIPRKVYGGIRCWRENGVGYTLRRIKEKFQSLSEGESI